MIDILRYHCASEKDLLFFTGEKKNNLKLLHGTQDWRAGIEYVFPSWEECSYMYAKKFGPYVEYFLIETMIRS